MFPAVGLPSHGVTVFNVTTAGRSWMPVCQVATGVAFKEQVATSLVVAPVIVIAGWACDIPALMMVPFDVEVPVPTVCVRVTELGIDVPLTVVAIAAPMFGVVNTGLSSPATVSALPLLLHIFRRCAVESAHMKSKPDAHVGAACSVALSASLNVNAVPLLLKSVVKLDEPAPRLNV